MRELGTDIPLTSTYIYMAHRIFLATEQVISSYTSMWKTYQVQLNHMKLCHACSMDIKEALWKINARLSPSPLNIKRTVLYIWRTRSPSTYSRTRHSNVLYFFISSRTKCYSGAKYFIQFVFDKEMKPLKMCGSRMVLEVTSTRGKKELNAKMPLK